MRTKILRNNPKIKQNNNGPAKSASFLISGPINPPRGFKTARVFSLICWKLIPISSNNGGSFGYPDVEKAASIPLESSTPELLLLFILPDGANWESIVPCTPPKAGYDVDTGLDEANCDCCCCGI
ncbi:hypothetical protein WICPIJ_008976 [Wickerhamomyces pijperi]|uniref:Uncharacterized protein n=1 Tax=Wickerhamomyces pijperi TaxID=599730 RepID=A0A9P8TG61_WICPI|nr:hypothetical protein WICPIJ_008976 [Wickerhamomyces pijperi]